jgi:hypothetical protein
MADRGYIGIPADGGVTARYLHGADAPAILMPTLRAIWVGLNHDSHRMAVALLAEDWSYLSAEQQQTGPYKILPGVGCPSPGGTRPRPAHIRLGDPIGAYLGWLYVLDPQTDIVTVYEATVHDRWLRHSVHQLRANDDAPIVAGPAAAE